MLFRCTDQYLMVYLSSHGDVNTDNVIPDNVVVNNILYDPQKVLYLFWS